MNQGHVTVLLEEAVDALQPRAGGVYIDGTFGGGGHSRELLERVHGDATLYVIDADPDAIARAEELRSTEIGRGVIPVHDNFSNLAEVARQRGISQVDGLLFDLGLSSFQLDQAGRGFAFRFDGPLERADRLGARLLLDDAQGEGLGRAVWQVMREETPTLFWRSRQGNPANAFYYAESDGSLKQDPWTVFWYGMDGFPAIERAVAHCAGRPATLVDRETVA